MDKINLGKVCVTPRGDYSAGTLYEALDIVMHLGITYICIDPSLPLSDPDGWMVIARTNGVPGKDGEAGQTGKSAYEDAVDLGYSGTVEEWIVSLKGEKGEKGEKGQESTVNGKTLVHLEAGDNIIIDEIGSTIKIHGKKGDVTKVYVDEQLSTKVDRLDGKVLSTHDYTSEEKTKLANVEDGANNYDDTDVRSEISRVEIIASGRNSARVFDDLTDIEAWLEIPENVDALKIGDQFLTKALGVPDYWWDGTTVQILETEKIDLTDYVEYGDIVDNLTTTNNKKTLSASQGVILNNKLKHRVVTSISIEDSAIKASSVDLQSGGTYKANLPLPVVSSVATGLMTPADKNKLDTVSDSAQANVIEKVSVDGTPLPITNKGVNLVMSNKVDKQASSISDLSGYLALFGLPIVAKQSFDDFNEPGVYSITADAVLNFPDGVSNKGLLVVLRTELESGKGILCQIYYSNDTNVDITPKYRTKYGDAAWTSWVKYGVNNSELTTATDAVSTDLTTKLNTAISNVTATISDLNLDVEANAESIAALNLSIANITASLDTKVDKADGKQLSTEDFTTNHKTKLEAIDTGALSNVIETVSLNGVTLPITDKKVNIDTTNKVDKVDGKVLSSNDYTTVEKDKLQGIATGAQVNNVNSVASRVGDVVLTKEDVGLDAVDNTADMDKPVSNAVAAELSNKVEEAPQDNRLWARNNAEWQEVPAAEVLEADKNNKAYARKNGAWVESVEEVVDDSPDIPGYVRNKSNWSTLQASLDKSIRQYGLMSIKPVEDLTNNLILKPYVNDVWKGYNFFIKYNSSTTYPISFGSAVDDFGEYCLTIHNNTSSTITQPIPNGVGWQSEMSSVQIAAGKYCEIFIKSVRGICLVRI